MIHNFLDPKYGDVSKRKFFSSKRLILLFLVWINKI